MEAGAGPKISARSSLTLKGMIRASIGRKRAKIGWHLLNDPSFRFSLTRRTRFYVHVPKTAGSSILEWCRHEGVPVIVIGHGDRHPGFKGATAWLEENDPDAFCVVRNPFDRLVSAYRYLVRGGNRASDKLDYQRVIAPYKDFRSFVLEGLGGPGKHEILRQIHLRPQIEWVRGRQGIAVGHVLRFERLQDDFDSLFRSWNLRSGLLPEVNRASRGLSDYREAYQLGDSPCLDMIKIVTTAYKEDFEFFGYEAHLSTP
jgi:hypothetical protein